MQHGDVAGSVVSDVFFIVAKYREILVMKCAGSPCLEAFDVADIISNIKQYMSSGKVLKSVSSAACAVSLPQCELNEATQTEVHNHYNYYYQGPDVPDETFVVLN